MNGHGKSDRFVVPANPPNKAAAAEAEEERERAKGNTDGKTAPDAVPGQVCQVRWTACGRLHDRIRKRGSPRCCTT